MNRDDSYKERGRKREIEITKIIKNIVIQYQDYFYQTKCDEGIQKLMI